LRQSFDQLEDQRMNAVVFLQSVNRGDVRMIECGERPRLAREPGETMGIGSERRWQRLQRDIATEPRIVGAVHLTHSVDAKEVRNAKGTELRACR
jgi:hypothetical protein